LHLDENTLAVVMRNQDPSQLRDAVLSARRARHWATVEHGLAALYPDRHSHLAAELGEKVAAHVRERPDPLFVRDLAREADPGWFLRPGTLGYVCYADLFGSTLQGLGERLDYLRELGVTYLHLMPLLRARDGENDGGYAVASYDEVEPGLGSMDDLARLADRLHEREMSLCVDLVLNHTAQEHPWALRARAGDPEYRDHYLFFPDRTMPDRYERTLLEVFPTFAPGNFTWLPDREEWVWTTFNEYQWDLNWANADVFRSMLEVMLHLSDVGVDVLRLDAAPFMWKREGTVCQNLPEVHLLLCTLRALMSIAAPATIFKAEAIVPPDELTRYLGAGDPPRHECDLAYNNQLMVLLWSCLATGDARLMTAAMRRLQPIPADATWVNYVRCHDDIGWAVTDEDAEAVGWHGVDHRAFLNRFYSGEFPTSFARGEMFQLDPKTGDGRISGSAASLCGIELALATDDHHHLALAVRRLELIYAVVYAFGGVPLLYMGDELAMCSDVAYLRDPAKADDNRWLHRPAMDWSVADRRATAGSLEAMVFDIFAALGRDRARLGALHGGQPSTVLDVDPRLFVFVRKHPLEGLFAMVANFSQQTVQVSPKWLGLAAPVVVERATGAHVDAGDIRLEPMGYAWLTA
jgi:amylosucrase